MSEEFDLDQNIMTDVVSLLGVHCWLVNGGDWIVAYNTVKTIVPAIAFIAPDSPVEYCEMAEADNAAVMLGYKDWGDLSGAAAQVLSELPWLEGTGEMFLKVAGATDGKLYPDEAVVALNKMVVRLWPFAKGRAGFRLLNISREFPDFIIKENDEEKRICGITTVNENWVPTQVGLCPLGDYHFAKAEPNDAVIDSFKELLPLVRLQMYAHNNRSWDKANDDLLSLIDGIGTFTQVTISSQLMDMPQEIRDDWNHRITDFTSKRADEKGNIEIHQNPDGTFDDEEVTEFMSLMAQTQQADYYLHAMKQATTDAEYFGDGGIVDKFFSCVLEYVVLAAGNDETKRQETCTALHDSLREKAKKDAKSDKSTWKAVIADTPELSEILKEDPVLIGIAEDGSISWRARG